MRLWLIGKASDAGRGWGQEEKGTTEDEMAGWHHWLDGREFEWTPGVGDGQGGLACCSSWGLKESDMTEQLNWSEVIWHSFFSDLLHVAEYPQDPSMLSQMTRFLFHDWIIFHCACEWVWESVCMLSHFLYPFIHHWTLYLGYSKCCCNEHEGVYIFWN